MALTGVQQATNFPRTIVGNAQQAVSAIIKAADTKELLAVTWSYVDAAFNTTTGFNNKTTGITGRIVVFDYEVQAAMFANNAPDGNTDFEQLGISPPIFDQILTEQSGQLLFDFNANLGRIMTSGDSPMTVLLCRAWETPKGASAISFIPRLSLQWRETSRDYITHPYDDRKGHR